MLARRAFLLASLVVTMTVASVGGTRLLYAPLSAKHLRGQLTSISEHRASLLLA